MMIFILIKIRFVISLWRLIVVLGLSLMLLYGISLLLFAHCVVDVRVCRLKADRCGRCRLSLLANVLMVMKSEFGESDTTI